MRFLFVLAFFIISSVSKLTAQQYTARVLDEKSREAIPFATIQYAAHKGVITNEEGRFAFTAKLKEGDTIKISSLGYEALETSAAHFKDSVIFLTPQSIRLSDVFLSNKNLSGEEILERVKNNISINYDLNLNQKRFFFRESQINKIRQFDLKVEESTIPELNQELMNKVTSSIPRVTDSYKEVLGDFYGNYDTQKIQLIKAANLNNPQNLADLEELSGKLENIFQQNIKSNSFLKIKSGLVGVKVDAEEFAEEMKDEKPDDEKSAEELQKERLQKQKDLGTFADSRIERLLQNMFWKEDITLDFFEKSRKYRFKHEGYAQMEDAVVYIISFEPKRGADFKGKLYVNTLDFGVYRLEYRNVKPLKKFRLFGISTVEDVYRGLMIFSKDELGKYQLKYLEQEQGESFGIERPLKVIEKNKFVKGRRKQNELDLDIKIHSGQISKYQMLVYENQPLTTKDFETLKPTTDFEYETFKTYNAGFWDGYDIIEPNAAIKAFTALEEQLN
ncbi:MAG TPA: carboxypeptidase-like regulatory domain-containing protein [Salegentibacter sp.]|uniref:carboxypeptidase-like regulatory domain-containing protein n=1 Tax=Salegentibacter sp. TaxID=1903072 RepID=UPI002F91DBC2